MPRALITGIGGQDGSLLAGFLLDQGYEVVGVARRDSENLESLRERVEVEAVDLLDQSALHRMFRAWTPDEVYNLAAPSFVPASWDEPVETAQSAAVGVTALLETVRSVCPSCRFYQASSSEIFGEPAESPQSEHTPLAPLTPYGIAKAYGHLLVGSYRRRYGLYACSGILYNHESPRRPLEFVPRKVARGAAAIALGLEEELVLGDLDARRDWGYAGDYVRAMWLMLQQDAPGDYVIATGVAHSVRELADAAFDVVGLDWERYVRVDESLVRGTAELHDLVGDATRARERLGWAPTLDFQGLVRLLVESELERLRAQRGAVEVR